MLRSDFQLLAARSDIDYLDGILVSLKEGVVVAEQMTNNEGEGLGVSRFSRRQDPWFYLHA